MAQVRVRLSIAANVSAAFAGPAASRRGRRLPGSSRPLPQQENRSGGAQGSPGPKRSTLRQSWTKQSGRPPDE
eukprot:8061529-Pyramimonas_sp.AAC.1